MVGGRVGRYLRVGVYTTFGLFFHLLHSYKICLHINTPLILFHSLPWPNPPPPFSRPPAFPSWCHSPCRTLLHPPDWLWPGCCDWPPSSPNRSGPGRRTARCGWWDHPGGRGREETRTRLSIWNPLPEGPPLTLGSGQSEKCPSDQTSHLCPGRKTSWGVVLEPEKWNERDDFWFNLDFNDWIYSFNISLSDCQSSLIM